MSPARSPTVLARNEPRNAPLLHPRHSRLHARCLIVWYAFDEDGRFLYRRGAKRGSKGPIVHSTPVMTPDGWTTHGELKVGSKVFAEDGSVTTVTDLRPEVLEPTYRVKFRD